MQFSIKQYTQDAIWFALFPYNIFMPRETVQFISCTVSNRKIVSPPDFKFWVGKHCCESNARKYPFIQ